MIRLRPWAQASFQRLEFEAPWLLRLRELRNLRPEGRPDGRG